MTDEMSTEKAEQLMQLAATTIDTASAPGFRDMHWLHIVSALAVACRGVAAREMARDPSLSLDDARSLMLNEFLRILAAPAELVRVANTEDEKARSTVIPVRKH